MRISLATSIAPRNIGLQQDAIATWMKLGFEVFSANSKDEINSIKGFFPDVKFAEVTRTGLAIAGKPVVYFDDIMKILESTGSEICGIVNSDIYLLAENSMIEFIAKESRDGFVFGSRIDVDNINSLIGEEYVQGFDFFFFNRSIIKSYLQTDFCLGTPWWDYWAPLVPIVKGLPTKQLTSPFAYHIKHPARWSGKYVSEFGSRFFDYLQHEQLHKYIEGELIDIISKKKLCYVSLALNILSFINSKSGKLFYHKPTDSSAVQGITYQDYIATRDELEYLKKHQAQLEHFMIGQITELEFNFRSSFSWRLTVPLRWLHDKLFQK
jgi:hypothetical protein